MLGDIVYGRHEAHRERAHDFALPGDRERDPLEAELSQRPEQARIGGSHARSPIELPERDRIEMIGVAVADEDAIERADGGDADADRMRDP